MGRLFPFLGAGRKRWRKIRQFSVPELWLLAEALALLPLTAVALRILGVRRWHSAMVRCSPVKAPPAPTPVSIDRIVRITQGAARFGFWRANCLEESLVLWWLLSWRAAQAGLRFGMRKGLRGVEAHAWVELDGRVLNETRDVHERYVPFARDSVGLARPADWPSRVPDRGDFSAEFELLLCCARISMTPATMARFRCLLDKPIDWASLRQMACRHGLLPLVHEHLRSIVPDRVPSDWLAEAREHAHRVAHRNLFMTSELCKVTAKLESDAVRAIPFKGPLLASEIYGNLAWREFEDLDILVSAADLHKAHAALASLGYRSMFRSPKALELAIVHGAGQYPFVRNDGALAVELHSELTLRHFPVRPDLEEIWGRSATVHLGGRSLRSLRPEDLLLFLSVHGAKDCWAQLKWVCDISELLARTPAMDWAAVLAQARRWRCERMLFLGLCLALELLETVLPEEIASRARAEPGLPQFAAQVRDRLAGLPGSIKSARWRSRFRAAMLENRRERARYCFRLATAPTQEDYELVALPAALYPLYAVLRPLRLAVESAKGWWRGSIPAARKERKRELAPTGKPIAKPCPASPGASLTGSPKIAFSMRVLPAPDVLMQTVEEEAVLLSLRCESYFGLDRIGTGMWSALTASDSIESAYQALLAEYDADPQQLRRDLEAFVTRLMEEGLVELRGAARI